MKKYNNLSDSEKKHIISEMYETHNKSFNDIANDLGTYANKIRRDAIKYGIKIKNKSEAQKNALNTGKHAHPTKGKKREDSVKQKIGLSVMKAWEDMPESELQNRKQIAKKNWEKLSDDEKKYINQRANIAVRETSKKGSKLEKFLLQALISDGYKPIFHQEQTLSNTKLQIDIFIPSISVAIEIDGPSHFEPVWGNEALKRNIKYDQKKTGLILGKGLVLIRIKQKSDFSKTRAFVVYDKLLQILKNIQKNFPTIDNRTFTIED